MSLEAACGWTLCRSLLVAFLAVPAAWWLRARLDTLPVRARTAIWVLLLVPFFTPALVTGYAYSKWSLALIRYPAWTEALYASLLTLRFIPIGALILDFTPPAPISAEALHCARLHARCVAGRWRRMRFLLPFTVRGPLRDAIPVSAIVFLLSFQEFETASLMGTASWTVWLFDAQAGGSLLSRTLSAAMLPVACEAILLAVFLIYAGRSHLLPAARRRQPGRVSATRDVVAWWFAIVACFAVTGIPISLLGRDAVKGIRPLLATTQFLEEIGIAAGFGLSAGIVAALLAWTIRSAPWQSRWRPWALTIGLLAALPGLLGSLVVSLLVLWLFQLPLLRMAYDTPLPAAVALMLFLLPRAMLLQLLFSTMVPQQGVHLGRLLASSANEHQRRSGKDIAWSLQHRPQVLAAGIVCLWGYLELTPVAVLAPPGVTSAPVRLYNLMHYGRSFAVAAMALAATLLPPGLLLCASFVRRRLWR